MFYDTDPLDGEAAYTTNSCGQSIDKNSCNKLVEIWLNQILKEERGTKRRKLKMEEEDYH